MTSSFCFQWYMGIFCMKPETRALNIKLKQITDKLIYPFYTDKRMRYLVTRTMWKREQRGADPQFFVDTIIDC